MNGPGTLATRCRAIIVCTITAYPPRGARPGTPGVHQRVALDAAQQRLHLGLWRCGVVAAWVGDRRAPETAPAAERKRGARRCGVRSCDSWPPSLLSPSHTPRAKRLEERLR